MEPVATRDRRVPTSAYIAARANTIERLSRRVTRSLSSERRFIPLLIARKGMRRAPIGKKVRAPEIVSLENERSNGT